jgi:hypothetical protein
MRAQQCPFLLSNARLGLAQTSGPRLCPRLQSQASFGLQMEAVVRLIAARIQSLILRTKVLLAGALFTKQSRKAFSRPARPDGALSSSMTIISAS